MKKFEFTNWLAKVGGITKEGILSDQAQLFELRPKLAKHIHSIVP